MTLKRRIANTLSLAFFVFYSICAITIFILFYQFRQDEFCGRLKVKADKVARLLFEENEVDGKLLKKIENIGNQSLIKEQTFIYNDRFQLIYSNTTSPLTPIDIREIMSLRKRNEIFKTVDNIDVLEEHIDFQHRDYFIVVMADDKFGLSKLNYLGSILVATGLIAWAIVWFISKRLASQLVEPLDGFTDKISHITAAALNKPMEVNDEIAEIARLTQSFNTLLERLSIAFQREKEFTSNASHELRTPISRMMVLADNLLQDKLLSPEKRRSILKITEDLNQMSELIHSLLILNRFEEKTFSELYGKVRVDEIIFSANDKLKISHPEFKLQIEWPQQKEEETDIDWLTIIGDASLLEIAFLNLFRNASLYGTDHKAKLTFTLHANNLLTICISNKGQELSEAEQQNLFTAFSRGSNSRHSSGLGLGLRITKRVLQHHQSDIHYQYFDGVHRFLMDLKIAP
jgi:signal transduction histidine kinase